MSPGDLAEAFPGGLDALLAIAARERPDAVLLRDDGEEASAAAAVRRSRRLAARLRAGGLRRGERVLILAGYEVAAVVALIAALRAGLDPVLAPPSLGPMELAAAVRAAGAVAMIGPSRHAGRDLGDGYLSAAAVNETVRGLLTYGPDPVDGAADISAAALDAGPPAGEDDEGGGWEGGESPALATLAGPAATPRLCWHAQAALLAEARSLAGQAGLLAPHAVVSLLPPATRAGLVAGPFAALAAATRLVLHGPFDSRRFLARCDVEPTYHLVAPAAAAGCLAEACRSAGFVSLVAVSRHGERFVLPPALPADSRCIDLHGFGEEVLLQQPRRGGVAEPPRGMPERGPVRGAQDPGARVPAVAAAGGQRR